MANRQGLVRRPTFAKPDVMAGTTRPTPLPYLYNFWANTLLVHYIICMRSRLPAIRAACREHQRLLSFFKRLGAWYCMFVMSAYGAAAGGLNGGPASITKRTLFDVFLRPWRSMAAAGLRSTMYVPPHNVTLSHVLTLHSQYIVSIVGLLTILSWMFPAMAASKSLCLCKRRGGQG